MTTGWTFLNGGGEMGDLTRQYNWAATSVGDPAQWPQSLRLTVSMILKSRFPMFLWWGDDLIQFYNDAYRPSLGNSGKHPTALGQKGKDCWPEIWDIIHPLIQQVRTTGEATWSEDQLIPIFRNGKIEDVYWTFGYSAIEEEDGHVAGVLVICTETTGKIRIAKKLEQSARYLEESERNLRGVLSQAPVAMSLFIGPEFRIHLTNERALKLWGRTLEAVHEKPLFEVIPEAAEQGYKEILERVYATGEKYNSYGRALEIRRNGAPEPIYISFTYEPYRVADGTIAGVLSVVTDVTAEVVSRQQIEESEQRFRTMAEGAAILIALSDETSNATFFNKAWTDFTGRSLKELLDFGWTDLVHEEDRKIFVDLCLAAFEKQAPWKGQLRMLNKDKEYRWILSTGSTRVRPDGSFAGYISSTIDITEQVTAQQKIEENELDLRNMVLQAPIGICVLDVPSLTCEVVNDKFIEVSGKPYEAIAGKFYWDAFAEARSFFEDALAKVVATGEAFEANEVELMLIRSGREENIWVTFVYAPLKDAQGNVKKVAVWVIENTQQVLIRQKIVNSEQEIRSLVEAAPFPIGVYRGREMRIAFANQSIMDVWGKGSDVIGKLFRDVLPELDYQEVFRQLDDVFTSGVPFHIKNQRLDLTFDGVPRIFYFNYSLTPLFDSNGKIYGVMNTGVDLTELNLAKREAEKSEKNLRNTILQAPVAMCIFRGPQFVVEIANDRMIELWGKPREAVMDKPIFVGLPEAAEQGFEAMLSGVYHTGKTFAAEGVPIMLPRDGKLETVFVNFVYEAHREADGSVSGVLSVAIEVTAQVLARQQIEQVVAERTKELEDANSKLHKSNAELAQFAYIASHDLQEPVRKISIFAQMLETNIGVDLDDKNRSYLERIRNASTRMQSLIRDVLSYSELARDTDTFEQVDLNEVLSAAKTDFELLIEQKAAVIDSAPLPTVEAIPLHMSQLLNNLLANALKFSRPDVPPLIKIRSETVKGSDLPDHLPLDQSADYYYITFSDNGIGFEPEYAEQIFSIFKRLHRKTEFEGTGIGLALCRKIAQNHRGFLDAAGSSARGAEFNLFLPVHQPRNSGASVN